MAALIAVQDRDGNCKIVVTRDPDAQLRQFRNYNPRIAGLALVRWAANEVVLRRVAETARRALEQRGWGREGGWLGTPAGVLSATVAEAALGAGVMLVTDEQRLAMAAAAMRARV